MHFYKKNILIGFTLVEALVTLALAAIVLPVTTRGILAASEAARVAREKTEAITLAEYKLADFLATGDWMSGDQAGDFGEEWPLYKWALHVDYWKQEGFRILTVNVKWSRGGKDFEAIISEIVNEGASP